MSVEQKIINSLMEDFSPEVKQAFEDAIALIAQDCGITKLEVLDSDDLVREAWLSTGLMVGV